jgi:hypothetical protein
MCMMARAVAALGHSHELLVVSACQSPCDVEAMLRSFSR